MTSYGRGRSRFEALHYAVRDRSRRPTQSHVAACGRLTSNYVSLPAIVTCLACLKKLNKGGK